MKKILMLLATLALTASAYAADVPDISIDELKSAIDSKQVVILDANGTESFQKGHIPGAIDFTAKKGDLASVLPADKNALIVAYCGGPKCKAYQKAANAAKKLGYTNVKHLSAGISGWTQGGQKTETSS
jgi:rhodanese-related sulfurtransferase